MGGIDNKTSDPTRRASMRTSMRLSVTPGQDDDYDIEAMGISDGFRPAGAAQLDEANLSPSSSHLTPSLAQSEPLRPSSIAKPPRRHDSLSLRHDGAMGPIVASSPSTSSSDSTAAPIPRPESPYRGPSGPSFPYQMYPQDVRPARTASMATTSTAPLAEGVYSGPSNPTHPYQMYPQNTIPVVGGTEGPTPAPIPVGFPGTTDNYQRRIGPDGEEMADMIGPDGHTEQLPPYTRYPDEAYVRKVAGIEQPTTAAAASSTTGPATTSSAVAAPPLALNTIPGAGGIGLATRNPEFASTEDLRLAGANSPQSRQSLRSFQTDTSHHEINQGALGVVNEKKELKKWQIVARKKIWNVVPCWALGLTIVILVMLAVVLGAILGTFFNKPKKPSPPNNSGAFSYDATPITSMPPNVPELTEGTFALPLMVTSSPNTCFNDSTQAQAWNCNAIFAQQQISVKSIPGQPDISQYSLSLNYNKSFTIDDNVYSYGMQPVSVQNVQLLLVTDVNEPSRGPAWAFEMAYNKTVIIPESLFPTPSVTRASASASATSKSNKNRRAPQFGGPPGPPPGGPGGPGGPDFKRKGVAQEGEKPWICYWGGTILEVFIYPSQNSSQNPVFINDGSSTSLSSTRSASATTTSAPASARYSGSDRRGTTTAPTGQATASSSTATTSSASPFETSMPPPSSFMMPFFPRVVKMEERRVNGSPAMTPFCRQYEIQQNGQPASPAKDESGNFVDVMIDEQEPTSGGDSSKSRFIGRHVIDDYLNNGIKPRDSGMSNCGCMWWAT